MGHQHEGMEEHADAGGASGPRPFERLARLVGAFAHEIKNPLSTIALNLRLMEEELQEPANAREKRFLTRTRRVRGEVDRLHGILEGFLSYVRAPQPKIESLSLNQLVRNVTDLVAPELEKEGIALRLLLTEGLADLEADPRLVHQVLLNLVRNAEQALLEVDHARELIVGTSIDVGDGPSVHVLSVTDNGPGMSEETIARCYEPYWSTKPGGSGLGLAITKRFVEDHGGEIRIESQPAVGTRFLVRLPSRSPLPHAVPDAPPLPDAPP
ncbi:MAG: hypothetical protein H6832_17185, partial [Planctomycetes bacterium]|nr:hypothetical protein [Planctomycetota bacterium]